MARDRLVGRKTLKVEGVLEEFEKDEIKHRVDIVALFESFGIKLARKGKGYSGLCPWHNDHEPSLSVDRDKGLYHCFGCGESGDVVDLVEKMKGLDLSCPFDEVQRMQFIRTLVHFPGLKTVPEFLRGQAILLLESTQALAGPVQTQFQHAQFRSNS